MKNTPFFNMLNRMLPSLRVGEDVDFRLSDPQYVPLPINRLRVTPLVKNYILARRTKNIACDFDSTKKLAVIIPFRDRDAHLIEMIPALRSVLDEQKLNYSVLVVEQEDGKLFNRGKLKNVGAVHLKNEADYFCFHDVDIIPINANYRCPTHPLRLVTKFQETWREKNLESGSFGGVISMSSDQYFRVNGYSNEYWGWGKEDDDLFLRMIFNGIVPLYDSEGLYRELPNPPHQNRSEPKTIAQNRKRKSRLARMHYDTTQDGLSNINYSVLSDDYLNGYRKLKVSI